MSRRFPVALLMSVLLTLALAWPCPGAGLPEEGKALEKAGKLREALAVFRAALERQPTRELYRACGSLCGKLREYDLGRRLVEPGLAAFPDDEGLRKLHALLNEKHRTARATGPADFTTAGTVTAPVTAAPPGADDGAPGPDETPLPPAEQAGQAKKLQAELRQIQPDEVATYEKKLREILFRCPTSPLAPDAGWKLSNLYLYAQVPPETGKARTILMHLWKNHPKCRWATFAANRLCTVFTEAGQHQDLLDLAREAPTRLVLDPDEKACWQCDEARALIGLGQPDAARTILTGVQKTWSTTPVASKVADQLLAGLPK
ncbi:MAG: hypothetical protein GX442_10205 [Candidatus Riflebacteria bacterium]|nr:hypothetical protein [Candidatus Riflebacteria bacterium]